MTIGKVAIAFIIALALSPLIVYVSVPPYAVSSIVLPASTQLVVVSNAISVNGELVVEEEISLSALDVIETSATGRALITFFEGSTTQLEPNTKVTIEEIIENVGGSTVIGLYQELGSTWNRVTKLFDTASSFEIRTNTAVACVRGTELNVDVNEQGDTEVSVAEGEVELEVDGKLVKVPGGKKTKVKDGLVGDVEDIPEPVSKLTVSIECPALLNVIDPLERNAGIVFPGFVVSEIPLGNVTWIPSEDKKNEFDSQTVMINEPISGVYGIVMHAKDNGLVKLTIIGRSKGGIFNYEEYQEITVQKNKVYVVPIEITVNEGGQITDFITGDEELTTKNKGNKGKGKDKDNPGQGND
ncbi:FecR domain-containing protein [Chloroflexota bacterium]